MVKASTGVALIDSLLGGGLSENSATMIYGPCFVGKEVFARLFLLQGLRQGVPAVAVVTDCTANQLRAQMAAMDPQFPTYERKGLLHVVDAYSSSIEAPPTEPADGLALGDLRRLSGAIRHAQKKAGEKSPHHRLLFDSASTLLAVSEARDAFRFLQAVVGRSRLAGATSALTLRQGMHTDQTVHAVKHLVDGIVEFRNERGKRMLQVEAADLSDSTGWVDYRFDVSGLEITGSFAGGRIRGHRG